MNIKIERNNNELMIALEGRLDTLTSSEVEEKLEESIDDVEKLIFDLKELEYMSSAGLRVLLSSVKTMEEQGGEMMIRNVQPAVMEVFEITGFIDILNIE